MRQGSSTARAIRRPRYRSIVTAMLVMALSLLIVRDILVRRISTFASGAPRSFGERNVDPKPPM
jgi:hypothetical protein